MMCQGNDKTFQHHKAHMDALQCPTCGCRSVGSLVLVFTHLLRSFIFFSSSVPLRVPLSLICSLEPNDSLASGVYAGQCTKCHTTLKFRVKAPAPAPPTACCGGKGCGSKGSTTKKAAAGSPDPITSISFTLNGSQVCGTEPTAHTAHVGLAGDGQ
jgi:hypothetical protein